MRGILARRMHRECCSVCPRRWERACPEATVRRGPPDLELTQAIVIIRWCTGRWYFFLRILGIDGRTNITLGTSSELLSTIASTFPTRSSRSTISPGPPRRSGENQKLQRWRPAEDHSAIPAPQGSAAQAVPSGSDFSADDVIATTASALPGIAKTLNSTAQFVRGICEHRKQGDDTLVIHNSPAKAGISAVAGAGCAKLALEDHDHATSMPARPRGTGPYRKSNGGGSAVIDCCWCATTLTGATKQPWNQSD